MEDSELFIDITNDDLTKNDLPIKFINCVPKIHVNEYEQLTHPLKQSVIMYVDIADKEHVVQLLTSRNDSLTVQFKYKLFWVNSIQLDSIIREIIQTTGKYVYPMIFVNYLKQSLNVNDKINFDNNLLLYIRIWSNQIRELAHKITPSLKPMPHKTNKITSLNHIIHDKSIQYIGYKICCELLYYYEYVIKRTGT